MKLDYDALLHEEKYTLEEVKNAALIYHPNYPGYNIAASEIAHIFEEGSNFMQLKKPIIDEHGNAYWDSEGYYMAQRINDLVAKRTISINSKRFGRSRTARDKYDLDKDDINRIDFMRNAIVAKYSNNPALKRKLKKTFDRMIIEYTSWKDTFFGIDQDTLQGSNILGKLSVLYRDNYIV